MKGHLPAAKLKRDGRACAFNDSASSAHEQIRDHSMFPLRGSVSTFSSVLRRVPFTTRKRSANYALASMNEF